MYQARVLLVIIYVAFVTVTKADECQDKFAPLCFKHKRLGHCSDSRWARNLKNLCQKTCNFCSGKKECVDVNQALCQQRKMRGECDQPSYFTLNMCKKTCDFCVSRKPTCKDNLKDCKRIASMGLCDKIGIDKLQCRLSCNICDGRKRMQ